MGTNKAKAGSQADTLGLGRRPTDRPQIKPRNNAKQRLNVVKRGPPEQSKESRGNNLHELVRARYGSFSATSPINLLEHGTLLKTIKLGAPTASFRAVRFLGSLF